MLKKIFTNEWTIAIGSVIVGCFITIVFLVPLYQKAKAKASA